ncbi:hypothetical protein DFH09DRAFT_1083631 [Mycena vulgaris]|nr:hypothetical protein DFH09DRAFT_1083631 [Mycena vulgaris]
MTSLADTSGMQWAWRPGSGWILLEVLCELAEDHPFDSGPGQPWELWANKPCAGGDSMHQCERIRHRAKSDSLATSWLPDSDVVVVIGWRLHRWLLCGSAVAMIISMGAGRCIGKRCTHGLRRGEKYYERKSSPKTSTEVVAISRVSKRQIDNLHAGLASGASGATASPTPPPTLMPAALLANRWRAHSASATRRGTTLMGNVRPPLVRAGRRPAAPGRRTCPELERTGVAPPFVFSALALDVRRAAVVRLVHAFLATCADGRRRRGARGGAVGGGGKGEGGREGRRLLRAVEGGGGGSTPYFRPSMRPVRVVGALCEVRSVDAECATCGAARTTVWLPGASSLIRRAVGDDDLRPPSALRPLFCFPSFFLPASVFSARAYERFRCVRAGSCVCVGVVLGPARGRFGWSVQRAGRWADGAACVPACPPASVSHAAAGMSLCAAPAADDPRSLFSFFLLLFRLLAALPSLPPFLCRLCVRLAAFLSDVVGRWWVGEAVAASIGERACEPEACKSSLR